MSSVEEEHDRLMSLPQFIPLPLPAGLHVVATLSTWQADRCRERGVAVEDPNAASASQDAAVVGRKSSQVRFGQVRSS